MVVLLAVLGGVYWYWSGPYQDSQPGGIEEQLRENTRAMDRCIKREKSITAGAGMLGADSGGGNPEELCAQQLNMYQRDGQWYSFDQD
jgi:hypothetical protein